MRHPLASIVVFLLVPAAALLALGLAPAAARAAEGLPMMPNTALIDDVTPRNPPLASPRFSVTLVRERAILLDSTTGDTWLLKLGDEKDGLRPRWIPIPRTSKSQ